MSIAERRELLGEDDNALRQEYFEGELRFLSRLKDINLDEGFDPGYDPSCDLGIDIDERRNFRVVCKELRANCTEAWRSISDFTELYCSLYETATIEEVEAMRDQYAAIEYGEETALDDLMSDMLECLTTDLEVKEEEESYPPYEKEIDDRITDEEWDFTWRSQYWRSLPGFPELYCSLYDSMSSRKIGNMVSQYLSVRLPDRIDPNMYFMLLALEFDLDDKECNIKRPHRYFYL